ncbi:MAG: hypothetical protein JWM10_921 [Myxococcaceae bacterium]|nr:hypothetical protein [Myxococcaceae bacterium]
MGRLLFLALLLLADAGCHRHRRRYASHRRVDLSLPDASTERDAGPPPSSIPMPPGTDILCFTDVECPGGYCFTSGMEAQYSRVFRDCPDGRAWRATHRVNTCLRAGCQSDAECPPGNRCADVQMLPFPQRACVPATCRTQWDCRRGRLGRCLEYVSGAQCTIGGWACSYPGDACAPQNYARLCPPRPGMIARCVPRNGRFGCVYEPPPAP